jgi:hypothetical protein
MPVLKPILCFHIIYLKDALALELTETAAAFVIFLSIECTNQSSHLPCALVKQRFS